MSTDEHSKKAQQLENLPAPLIMNDIRDVGLLHSRLDLPQVTPLELQQQAASLELKQATSNLMEDIFTKARLIEILRERERLQRSRPKKVQKKASTTKVCVFCRNNGEAETVYSSHQLKDPEGNVTCPILYIYTCPICGANGKMAHTIKYCPYNSARLSVHSTPESRYHISHRQAISQSNINWNSFIRTCFIFHIKPIICQKLGSHNEFVILCFL